jgi:cell division protein FtsL
MATAFQWQQVPGGDGFLREPRVVRGQGGVPQRLKPEVVPTAPRLHRGFSARKPAMVEFHTVKRIDNSRLVRHVEPVKLKNYYKTAALGGIVAMFFMLYIYQHFRCIDLSFQLEELKGRQVLAQAANSKLKLEIATLRDPRRIDVIARHQLGLTQPTANQVREYAAMDEAVVAAVQHVRPNRAP